LVKTIASHLRSPEPVTLFEGDSEYAHITVRDNGDVRTLYFGPLAMEAETSISLSQPDAPIFEYPGMMFLSLALSPRNANILMLGLGGGYIPRLFQEYLPNHNLTVVEIDPLVAEIASTYFFFAPGANVRLIVEDGYKHILESPRSAYDQIWLDAFSGNYIPSHLATEEFLEICRLHVEPEGLLVQNLHVTRLYDFGRQLRRTVNVFGARPLLYEGTRCGNAIAISLNSPAGVPALADWQIKEAALKFGAKIGPYNLLEELRKKSKEAKYFL
jgi:spermidine synthase